MRMILLIIFFIVSIFSILGYFNYYNNKEDIMEKETFKNKTLEEKIKVPEGLEREYAMIFRGESPFNLKNESNEENDKISSDLKKDISINKETKIDFSNENDIPTPQNINTTNKKTLVKNQHDYIKTNIKEYSIINDNLIVDILLYNNTETNISGFGRIKCTAYNSELKPVDQFKWSGNFSLKPKKAILLKNTNFGYAGMNTISEIWCYVDSFKHNYKEESNFK